MNKIILATALLPVAVLLYYIYKKDKYAPEPASELVKAFFYGVASLFCSLIITTPLIALDIFPSLSSGITTFSDAFCLSFFSAAIPEEVAKFAMLWLLLRNNKYFDEKVDGIVYAVCVSMGFAALENIMYLFSDVENFISIGISRAVFSVPAHFCFGVLMGYYYSLVRFYPDTHVKNRYLVLLAPIIAHGIYDTLLFCISLETTMTIIIFIVFLVFCRFMWKYCKNRIKELLARDAEDNIVNENNIVNNE